MQIKYFPDQDTVQKAMETNDPLLVLIAYDGSEMLLSNIDDAFEHTILLKKLNYRETDIDKFFRIVLNKEGADWTFVCPSDYQDIKDKNKRIETFYNDGIIRIEKAINKIGYNVKINIPQRYRRHFDILKES